MIDDDIPYEDITDMVPGIFRDADKEWVNTYKTIQAITLNGYDGYVLVLFGRPDLSSENGGYFHIARFKMDKGIGDRAIFSWDKCEVFRGIRAELAMDEWTEIKCGNHQRIRRYIDVYGTDDDFMTPVVSEDTFGNQTPSGFALSGRSPSCRWKIIEHFEIEGQQHSFLVCLTLMTWSAPSRDDLNPALASQSKEQIAYIEIIQGIGGRTQIDWQNVRLGPGGDSMDLRFQQIRKFSSTGEGEREALIDSISVVRPDQVSHLYFDR